MNSTRLKQRMLSIMVPIGPNVNTEALSQLRSFFARRTTTPLHGKHDRTYVHSRQARLLEGADDGYYLS